MSRILQIHPDDNVAVALEPLKAGEVVETSAGAVTLREDIPQGHKLALMDIPSEAAVVKYGFPIGHATQAIHVGDWVHSHDLATSLNEEAVTAAAITPVQEAPAAARTFRGFRRKGGVGIRNEIWIIPTVGCVNSVAETLARIVSHDIRGSVTGVYAWPHPYGCSQTGDDQEHTRRILCDLICHPNAGGVLVLGLGCENSNIGELKKLLGDWDPERIAFLECQSVPDELEAGKVLLRRLIGHAAKDVRCSIPVSELVVGLKCGGSDGLSGITANPLVGRIADRLVAMGGTALLAEVPEMFGAEGCCSAAVPTKQYKRNCRHWWRISRTTSSATGRWCMKIPPPATRPAVSPRWRRSRWAASRRAAVPPFAGCCPMVSGCRTGV